MRSARSCFVRLSLEALEVRLLLASSLVAGLGTPGTISGSIFADSNANGVRDSGEHGVSGVVVYLDSNRNGRLDAAEKWVKSAADGSYLFTGLAPGTYFVNELTPLAWKGIAAPVQVVVTSPTPLISSSADRLIGLDRFRADPRFAGIDGAGFSVALLDTGIDALNSAFGTNSILFQKDFLSGSSVATDTLGHGTEMSNLIGSRDVNHPGIAPGVNLIMLKVLGDTGSFDTIDEALRWVEDNAAKYHIICVNMSLGEGSNYDHLQGRDGIDSDLHNLVAHNITVIAAAGNSYHGQNNVPGLDYPAADPSVIPVGAVWDRNRGGTWKWSDDTRDYTTGSDRIVSFSQRLPSVGELLAPGTFLPTVLPGGAATTVSGTSAASAVVSGLVALAQELAQTRLGRTLTTEEIRNLLNRTGKTIVDGANENDSVNHTSASFSRVDAFAMGEAILALAAKSARSGIARVPAGQAISGVNLGLSSPMRIAGVTFRDTNGNGRFDAGESFLGGVTVFADANVNGRLDPGEQRAVSGPDGRFSLTNLDPGTYDILQIVPPGSRSTTSIVHLVVAAGVNRSDLRLGSQLLASGHGPALPSRLIALNG